MKRNILYTGIYFAAIASDWLLLINGATPPSDQSLKSYYLYFVLAAGIIFSFAIKPNSRIFFFLLPAVAIESLARFYFIHGSQPLMPQLFYVSFFCLVYSMPVLLYLTFRIIRRKVSQT